MTFVIINTNLAVRPVRDHPIPNHRDRLEVRPHLWKNEKGDGWYCARKPAGHSYPEYSINGMAPTALEAWARWKIRDQRRVRIPRAGIQNKRDTRNWFFDGCFYISSYISHEGVLRIIHGYDPITDELILRG
jgi:hypothetical protein